MRGQQARSIRCGEYAGYTVIIRATLRIRLRVDFEGKNTHARHIPDAGKRQNERKKRDCDGEGGFLGAGALEEFQRNKPGSEEAKERPGTRM